MHGGTVTAHSDGRGQGQRVRRAAAARDAAPETRAAPRARRALALADAARGSSSSRTTPTAARCCASCSRSAGFECATADDGAAGARADRRGRARRRDPRHRAAGMDGFELARRVRARPAARATCCLIALTGYGQPTDRATRAARPASTSTSSSRSSRTLTRGCCSRGSAGITATRRSKARSNAGRASDSANPRHARAFAVCAGVTPRRSRGRARMPPSAPRAKTSLRARGISFGFAD